MHYSSDFRDGVVCLYTICSCI